MDIYPVYEENLPDVTVLVNGISVDGSSLEDAIKDSKVAVADDEHRTVSGEITQNGSGISCTDNESGEIHDASGEDLILHGKDGIRQRYWDTNSAVLNLHRRHPKQQGEN